MMYENRGKKSRRTGRVFKTTVVPAVEPLNRSMEENKVSTPNAQIVETLMAQLNIVDETKEVTVRSGYNLFQRVWKTLDQDAKGSRHSCST